MKSILITLTMFLPLLMSGQSQMLDQYIREGLEKNLGLVKEELALREQQLKVEEAKGKFLPTISINGTYLWSRGGRRIQFPVGTLFNPVYGTLNEITGTSGFPTNLQDENIQLTPTNFHDTRLIISQPLFNPAIYFNRKAQEQLVTVQEAKVQAYTSELKKEIKVAYYNFLKTKAVQEVYDSTEVMLQEVLRFNRKMVKYDKATADVVASVEFELANLARDRSGIIQQEKVAQAYFNTLLHRDPQTAILIDTLLTYQTGSPATVTDIQEQALGQRHEIMQLQRGIRANQITTELNRKSMLPTLGLEVTGGYQGEGYSFDSEQRLGTIGLGLNWTLYQGKQRQKRIEQSQIRTRQLEQDLAMVKQQIQLQVIDAWNAHKAAETNITAEKAALRSATQSFNIINRRYRSQQALLVEYLDARTKYTNARIALSIAQYDILIREAELARAVEW